MFSCCVSPRGGIDGKILRPSMLSINGGNRLDSVEKWKRERKSAAAKDSIFLDLARVEEKKLGT
jgi:hypothetical protein